MSKKPLTGFSDGKYQIKAVNSGLSNTVRVVEGLVVLAGPYGATGHVMEYYADAGCTIIRLPTVTVPEATSWFHKQLVDVQHQVIEIYLQWYCSQFRLLGSHVTRLQPADMWTWLADELCDNNSYIRDLG
jgi:hypothetical protein